MDLLSKAEILQNIIAEGHVSVKIIEYKSGQNQFWILQFPHMNSSKSKHTGFLPICMWQNVTRHMQKKQQNKTFM